jgi:hypothetical protein
MMALSKKMLSMNTLSQGGKATLTAKSGIMAKDYSGGTGGIDSVNVASPKFVPAGLRVRANEKLLYVLYFQTSKHSTLAEKINQLKFSKTEHAQYWDIHEDLVASFASDEWWDDYDMHGFVKKGRNSNEDEQGDPIILVDAVHTNQAWFTGFARPSIYDHIINLAVRGLWSTQVPIADGRFYGQPSWSHPDPQAIYASSALGLISVPYVSVSPPPHSLSQAAHFSSSSLGLSLGSSSAIYTLKVKYLHGTNIPTDFTNLYFATMRILSEYYTGGADDDGCEIYGKGDWIQNNFGWIQGLGSRSIFNYTGLYTTMYEDTYTVDFAYSPKFDWNANGPWIAKNFTYGHPSVIQAAPAIQAPAKSSATKRMIIRP